MLWCTLKEIAWGERLVSVSILSLQKPRAGQYFFNLYMLTRRTPAIGYTYLVIALSKGLDKRLSSFGC